MSEATCKNCKWWKRGEGGLIEYAGEIFDRENRRGDCHVRSRWIFPSMHQDDFCGEHTPKEPTP